jgi:GNAT superfamily N-acetyltransferase
MWWRLKRSEWTRNKGEGNRLAMKELVESGRTPGILAYDGDLAVGWCAVEPRENYPVLENARTLKAIDDRKVWSVTCFFVRKEYRKKGVSVALLKAAAKHVRQQGGKLIEGYPVVPSKNSMPDAFAWTGLLASFEKAGFKECARPSATRRVVRRSL